MFTVIIAEKEHIEKTEEYGLFLKPFLASGEVVFCQWNTEKERLVDMLPDLADKVGRRKLWRAVIVCDEAGIGKQNPFDMVKNLPGRFKGFVRGSMNADEDSAELQHNLMCSEEYQQFLQNEHEKKLLAYSEAAQNPLTRLVTFFCNPPSVTKQEDSELLSEDPDYIRYVKENRRKTELRQEILADEVIETSQPTEVICVAKRTYVSNENEFSTVWSSHTELEYSRFYDRNMYFDKMRYLVFDILPKTQRDYPFDYIRFLYATILLASNEVPPGCLAAERVYKLECENDEAALSQLLQTYEAKLNITEEVIKQYIQELQEKKPEMMSEQEVEQLFRTRITQPVILDDTFTTDGLYAKTGQIGLANGCQREEAFVWEEEYNRSQKHLAKMLKLSHRAVKKAANSARMQDNLPGNVWNIHAYQLEDIQEYTDQQELEMQKTNIIDLYDENGFYEKMEAHDKKVRAKINERMDRKTTVTIGLISCLLFLLSFVTLFFKNGQRNIFNIASSFAFAGIGLGVFVLIALVTLFCLREEVVFRFRTFNNLMHGISNQVYGAMDQYAKYLEHLCSVRRGYELLNKAEKRENPDIGKIILYKKHIADIEQTKAETRKVFGQFMVGSRKVQDEQLSAYEFDFEVPMQYKYPLPYTEGTARKITFIQTGVSVEVPVKFVKQITVRREELYE